MGMRLALLGAFPFPVAQGSQRFASEQARALEAAGAETTLFCYGSGDGRDPGELRVARAPAALSPRRLRAGFDLRKPLADLALLWTFLARHRRERFHAVLAHNAEAALLALAARSLGGPPVVYVAHTLWAEELSTYLPAAAAGDGEEPADWAARGGARLDARLAASADGVVTLSRRAEERLARWAPGRVACIAPGLATRPAPPPEAAASLARRYGLVPGGFAVYAGNLDAYQDLPLLDAAAARVPALPVVALTHDPRGPRLRHVALHVVSDPEEVRELLFAARFALLPRRRAGGFPIKLLHYMEAGLPIAAHASVAHTLEDGVSAILLSDGAGPGDWARVLERLDGDAALRARLGAGARRALAERHDWAHLARCTLARVSAARAAATAPQRHAAGRPASGSEAGSGRAAARG